ncbi:hypothetical protein BDV98DRAFT_580112 [Pterulicium gracile]|uniref:Uncharacterized protein n=1 Tax=Pterulicium gracile TaxID=1884261 RepID=A0A5C3QSD3_9AGAR|nr:hypothetical protein BDV98DRAFT_580112 [Pterula gracilis]
MWTRGCCGIALGSLVLDTEDTAVLCASALDLSFDLMLVSFHVPVYQHWKTPASNFDVPSAAVLGGSIVYGTNDAYLKQQVECQYWASEIIGGIEPGIRGQIRGLNSSKLDGGWSPN